VSSQHSILLYSNGNRAGVIAEINDAGDLITLREIAPESFGAWTHVASDGRRILFYSNSNRAGVIAEINDAGDLITLREIAPESFGAWTHIA
jgi:Tfp pilus assembly protein PilP